MTALDAVFCPSDIHSSIVANFLVFFFIFFIFSFFDFVSSSQFSDFFFKGKQFSVN